MTRLVQLQRGKARRVALVEEPHLRLLAGVKTIYDLAARVEAVGGSLAGTARELASATRLDYDAVYSGQSVWRMLPPFNHPGEPARCLISGTGLTHLGSAKNRQAMHDTSGAEVTDSIKMFRLGVEGGKPAPGAIGAAPEWFYKGTGENLRAHGEPLEVPPFAEDGGEEGEIAGVYYIGKDGRPRRVGMAIGNEFSDHKFEKKNYLNLAGSKLRTCSIGPELTINPDFESVPGAVKIHRGNKILWAKDILTGEIEMCHSLANIEHHHFKIPGHRRPGDAHIHFYGACSLSFGAGIELKDGDVMEISFAGFGRPLRNPLKAARGANRLIKAKRLS